MSCRESTSLESLPTISVIIPTYNRKESLRNTLNSLAKQTCPGDYFEVIVVDDGSTDGTQEIVAETYPFTLRYFWQINQGDAEARNLGARQSQADILVFLDDDMWVDPGYLTYLIQAHDTCQNRIVVGTWHLWLEDTNPFDQTSYTLPGADNAHSSVELLFRDVYSNNMSLWREAYFKIGMMHSLEFPGSSMWCDLDFAYRAYLQGYEFRRSTKALCWHRDFSARNLNDRKIRMRTAAYRAVVLFQKYPELLPHLPMFYDKTPIIWGHDSPHLIARKLIRYLASSRPVLWGLEQLIKTLENHYPLSTKLRSLKRYIIGSYIFQGFREGLRESKIARAQD